MCASAQPPLQGCLGSLTRRRLPAPTASPARVLKICAAELSSPLSSLYSACFRQGVYPSLWKTANVVPVHKKQARSSMKNYRPVSLLSVVSKVMEKVINTTLMNHLEKKRLLSQHQFGFRTGLSAADLLAHLSHQWLSCMNTSGAVRTVAVDIAGAFDKVSHLGVLHKLRSYGIAGTLHQWMTSYLTDPQSPSRRRIWISLPPSVLREPSLKQLQRFKTKAYKPLT